MSVDSDCQLTRIAPGPADRPGRRQASRTRADDRDMLIHHVSVADHVRTRWTADPRAGRDRAWRVLAGQGFRRDFQGATMHRPNEPGYSTSDSFVIDDWR